MRPIHGRELTIVKFVSSIDVICMRYMCQRFNYLKCGYLCQEARLIEAEIKGEQQQSVVVQVTMSSEGTELDDNSVLARGVTRET